MAGYQPYPSGLEDLKQQAYDGLARDRARLTSKNAPIYIVN